MTRIFLHGLGQSPTDWEDVFSGLEGEGPQPEAYDIVSGEQKDYPALYREFSRRCQKAAEPLALCGLSLGAVVALNYALDHPERVEALVLIAPQYRTPKGLLRLQNILFRCMPASAFGKMGLGKRDMLTLTNSMMELDFTSRLRELNCPTLVLCGERDKANQKAAKTLAELAPRAVFQIVKGAGHEVNQDAPEVLAKQLNEFWNHCSDEKEGRQRKLP